MKAGKILIVEDDPLWQEFLQEPLQNEYELTLAATKSEALAALNQAQASRDPFVVATVDIGLEPDSLGGEDILALIQKKHCSTRCIVVTGHHQVGMARLRTYFKEFEVFDYIGKDDFDLLRFKEMVDRAFYFCGYRLVAELGRGGMSTVYKARDPQNYHRVVALKVLRYDPRLEAKEEERREIRFKQEVETIRKLDHPHIVKVFDYQVGFDNNKKQTFFVMECLSGPTLDEVLASERLLSPEKVKVLGLQLGDALAYAHTRQVVHRDIKPSNIILLAQNRLKITDFGIAKVMDADISLTKTEEIVGTLDYMPPEQILNAKGIDHRVDIYAAGVVLYELLSGKKPYKDALVKLKSKDPTPLLVANPAVPSSLAGVVMRALQLDPNRRYQTAADMVAALQTC